MPEMALPQLPAAKAAWPLFMPAEVLAEWLKDRRVAERTTPRSTSR
jgi:hypothetical protein